MRGWWMVAMLGAIGVARGDSSVPLPRTTPTPAADGRDRDRDGVPDAFDKCPDAREDADGFEDEDGCPDPDNDGDGILDPDDECPYEPGPSDSPYGVGCPRVHCRGIIDGCSLSIVDTVEFRPGSSALPAQALKRLDAIAATLRGNPQMSVEIIGHRGAREPTIIAKRRALAVRAWLADSGVLLDRLYFSATGSPRRRRRLKAFPLAPRSVEFAVIYDLMRPHPAGTLSPGVHVQ